MYDLDLRNRKILSELDLNARIPLSTLSKKVLLSKQVVKYRIDKLINDNIIQGYNSIIDVSLLGKTRYLVYFKLVKLSTAEEQEWIEELYNSPKVSLVAKTIGAWDLILMLFTKSDVELDTILNDLTKNKKLNIREKLITSEIESRYFGVSLLHAQNNPSKRRSKTSETMEFDEKDESILMLLAKNCRINLVDISKEIKLTPNAVKDRIKKLEEKNCLIAHRTKINYELLGYFHFRVFLFLEYIDDLIFNKISDFLEFTGCVENVGRYMGYSDVDFRCYVTSMNEFYDLISKIKDNFKDYIIDVNSIVLFNWRKISYYH